MNYGKALRIARAVAGFEQKQLANAAGLDPSHISLIEKGTRKPSVAAIGKLSRALGIPEPLFSMLAAQKNDLHGKEEQDFPKNGGFLAKFLLRGEPTLNRTKRKQRS